MGNLVYSPWTDEQVAALNRWQECEWVHPFTCVEHSQHALVATVDGWVCLWCDYTQNWAHDFMTQPPPENPFKKEKI